MVRCVYACYRELAADPNDPEEHGIRMALLELMGKRYFENKAACADHAHCTYSH